MKPYHYILSSIFALLLFASCSVSKHLPEGQKLYTGARLLMEKPDTLVATDLQENLEAAIIPEPNARLFRFPWKVWFYLKFKTDKQRGFKHWLSTAIGEPPVLYDPGQVDQVIRLLENRAQNLGHFRAQAEANVKEGPKKVSIDYSIKVRRAYQIDSLQMQIVDTSLSRRISRLQPNTLIRKGDLFSLDKLKEERQRIETALRDSGYYFFSGNNLEYFADTVSFTNAKNVNLLLKLKNDLPSQNLKPQTVTTVNVYPNYQLNTGRRRQMDSTRLEGINLYCTECPLKLNTLTEAIVVEPGTIYQPSTHRKTLERLSNLNTFKYINLNYEPVPGSDSLLILNAYLSPRARRTIKGEVGVSYNTGQYFGPELSLQYINRNLFQGAEYLTLDGQYSYNTFLGPEDEAIIPDWTKISFGATLSIPRFWLPKREALSKNLQYANTRIRLSVDNESLGFRLANLSSQIDELGLTSLQQKLEADSSFTPPVQLANYQLKYGYNWQKVLTVQHEINPLVFRLQTVGVDDPELLRLFRAFSVGEQSSLVRLERMQLFSPDYTFLYDSRKGKLKERNLFYRQRVSFNVNRVTPLNDDTNTDSETSLFLQWETDLHYYFNLGKGRQLASRLRLYTGYPISKTATIPYFDLYTVGGANSLRGFSPRGVGPGTIAPDLEEDFTIFTGYGNVLLEANLEYRHRFGPYLELAPFIDAGNVWQYRTQSQVPKAEFSLNSFASELAVDAGLGLRYDLEFLIIRTDFAWPVTKPWLDPGERLVINQFFQGGWWWENLNFVLAFGYPF